MRHAGKIILQSNQRYVKGYGLCSSESVQPDDNFQTAENGSARTGINSEVRHETHQVSAQATQPSECMISHGLISHVLLIYRGYWKGKRLDVVLVSPKIRKADQSCGREMMP
jgi:hypothetical protein